MAIQKIAARLRSGAQPAEYERRWRPKKTAAPWEIMPADDSKPCEATGSSARPRLKTGGPRLGSVLAAYPAPPPVANS